MCLHKNEMVKLTVAFIIKLFVIQEIIYNLHKVGVVYNQ